jgi:hypothetical protein
MFLIDQWLEANTGDDAKIAIYSTCKGRCKKHIEQSGVLYVYAHDNSLIHEILNNRLSSNDEKEEKCAHIVFDSELTIEQLITSYGKTVDVASKFNREIFTAAFTQCLHAIIDELPKYTRRIVWTAFFDAHTWAPGEIIEPMLKFDTHLIANSVEFIEAVSHVIATMGKKPSAMSMFKFNI